MNISNRSSPATAVFSQLNKDAPPPDLCRIPCLRISLLSFRRTSQAIAVAVVFLLGAQSSTMAQTPVQNPITAAREALRKAQEEGRKTLEAMRQQAAQPGVPAQPAQPAAPEQPAPPGAAAQPAPSARSPGLQPAAGAAPQATADTTARIAATLGYLDVAGIKFGMSLTNTTARLKTINPRFQYRPQTEIIWPLDLSNTAAQPPADAPKSTISVVAESIEGKGNVEVFDVQFASHPNAPIVIGIQRKLGWAPGTGPSFDALVDDLRKKYGPESTVVSKTTDSAQRNIILRWHHDPGGQQLQGSLAQQTQCAVVSGAPPPGLCGTLVVLDASVFAAANGVVRELLIHAGSHPLVTSARGATAAYLKSVEANRANRQRIESTGRARPTL